jgi:hypothetical protein
LLLQLTHGCIDGLELFTPWDAQISALPPQLGQTVVLIQQVQTMKLQIHER